jgi:hypothetical protein
VTNTAGAQISADKKPRVRQNRPYPTLAFEEVERFCQQIYEYGSGNSVVRINFFDHIEKSPESSASRMLITAANKFGMLKGSYSAEKIEITNDALFIVQEGGIPIAKSRKRIEVIFQNVEVFKKLYDKTVGNRLPARRALEEFAAEMGVEDGLKTECIELFEANFRYLGLIKALSGAERVLSVDAAFEKDNEINSGFNSETIQDKKITTGGIVASDDATFDRICFYITPIGDPDSVERKHADLFMGSIVEPVIEEAGLKLVRADRIEQPGTITRQILEHVVKSRLVIADMSFLNPNVFYELAIRHAIKKPCIHLIRKRDRIPFDVNQSRAIVIDDGDLYVFVPNIEAYKNALSLQVRAAMSGTSEIDNPISAYGLI